MKIILNIAKRLILFLINTSVLILSLIIPKSKKIVVIGGWFGQRFADNSKHAFLYLNNLSRELGFNKIVWITRLPNIAKELNDQGYRAYQAWSLLSVWYHLRAKYHLIDQSPKDINAFFSVRSVRLNLWHGFPLKKVGFYMGLKDFDKKSPLKHFIYMVTSRGFWADQVVLATSEFSKEILSKAFGVESDKFIISGYPRNYELIFNRDIEYKPSNEKASLDAVGDFSKSGFNIIGYFPTFRDNMETLVFGEEDVNKLVQFLDYCIERKIRIVSKFHFAGKNDNFERIGRHPALINLPSSADVYTYLDHIDLLITDYSSIYFDFLLLNRPIIFFPYDLEYYKKYDRGLIFDYDEFTPGFKVTSIKELKNILQLDLDDICLSYNNEYGYEAVKLRKRIFGDVTSMDINHLVKQLRERG